jgi:oligopeptide transport system permease protein
VRGDLRLSTKYRNRSVNEILAQSLPVSAALGGVAFFLSAGLGIAIGATAAAFHRGWADAGLMALALLAISLPTFVTGPVLILVFSLKLGWLPVGGWEGAASVILPAVTLAGPYTAYVARLMRSSTLEALAHEHIRTARAKGLPEWRVVCGHALKPALLPVVSFLGPLAANLLTGSIVVEAVFNIPGAGGFFVHSILNRDGFLLGGVVIVYCSLLVAFNTAVDLLYGWLDPRIRVDA